MKIKLLALTLLSLFSSLPTFASASAQPVIAGYWSNWGIYWPNRPYPASGSLDNAGKPITNPAFDSQMQKLTVANYSFMEVNENGSIYFNDPWADLAASDAPFCQQHTEVCFNQVPSYGLGNFAGFVSQKAKYPNLRIQVAIGGWDHDATFERGAFAHPDTFVKSLKALVDYYHIDGIDLDYEPQGGWNSTNSKQLLTLAQSIHAAIPNFKITMAGPADPARVRAFDDGASHNWKAFMQVVDYVGVMTYDMHGSFDNPKVTGLQSGLYFDANEPTDPSYGHFNTDVAIQAYLDAGIAPSQLVLGIPAYARFYDGVAATNNGLFQSFSGAPMGDLGAPGGMQSYYAIVKQWLNGGGYTEYMSMVDGKANGAWAYNPQSGIFGSYDNTAVVDSKAQYVKDRGLGGMMVWELRADLPTNEDGSLLGHMAKGLN